MSVSIKTLLHKYAATLEKQWKHDRSKTVGASEIGKCARQTWFSKHDAPRDEGYEDSWGARLRGTIIEDAFWVPALRATLPEGTSLLFAGEHQETLVSGYLSATTDGLMLDDATGYCVNLDCKSIDSRADISKPKTEHSFQVQAQMGLIRECTNYTPDSSILSYIDSSFWDTITEFVIPFNPRIYAAAHARAEQIMTASEALDLPPEGKMAGGSECDYCAWASHCADVTVAGVPRDTRPLDETLVPELLLMRYAAIAARDARDEAEIAYAAAIENIKQFMRGQNTRSYRGNGWSVSYSTVNGRSILDIAAIEAAGVDLAPYYKTGKSSERLTVK